MATYWLGRELVRYWVLGIDTPWHDLAVSEKPQTEKTNTQSLIPLHSIPLLAALYLATSYWHVHFSRFGIRGVFTPLCGALAFAAFWRGVNQRISESANQRISESANQRIGESANQRIGESANQRIGESANQRIANHAIQRIIRHSLIRHSLIRHSLIRHSLIRSFAWFALSGFFLGLATHFYTASRFFPFFLGGFLVLQAIVAYAAGRRAEAILVRHFRGIVVLYAVAALVFLPLGIYFLQHPGSFAQRASEVVATNDASPWLRMGQAAAANILQFFVPGRGDPAQFYNLPGRPVFDLLTAVLALLGIGALLRRWRRPAALFLLTWFPALLLPSFLATDRFPTLPRVLGVIPGVYFFPAVGALWPFKFGCCTRRATEERGAGDGGRGSLRVSVRLLLHLFLLRARLSSTRASPTATTSAPGGRQRRRSTRSRGT